MEAGGRGHICSLAPPSRLPNAPPLCPAMPLPRSPAVRPFSTAPWYSLHASSFSLTKATNSCPETSMAKREMKAVSGRMTVRKISRAPASGLCTSLVTSVVAYLEVDHGRGRETKVR